MSQCPMMSPCIYKALIWADVAISFAMGFWFMRNPKGVIAKQIAAYRLFRWKIEPISMEREIKLTQTIGGLAVLMAALTSLVLLWRAGGFCGMK